MRIKIRVAVITAVFAAAVSARAQDILAPSPPMGWISWDSYGFTIDEGDFKANAGVLASLRDYGWTTAVVDEGWYMDDPLGDKLATRRYQLDGNGLLIPSVKRYPSSANGAGFKPLADWVHSQGLKFGVHILRGIPKDAVDADLPIAGTSFRAKDAADLMDTCPWDDGNYGIRDNAAGQAYYDALMRQYAGWGIDYVKVDCIADHPYKPVEIRQISDAIKKSGRAIVLSLSPGPTQLAHGPEVAQYAQLWRIGDDTWDGWTFPHDNPASEWPLGVRDGFDKLAMWHPFAKPGTWPDADMLPFGTLAPHPGWGDARQSRLTPDETRTQFTLWAIARSPLILGANLTKLDDFTRSLITNKEVIQVNQTAWESEPVTGLPPSYANMRVWRALTGPHDMPVFTVALFNLADKPVTVKPTWKELGVPAPHRGVRELWSGRVSKHIAVTLPAHGSAIFRIE
jgi:alpha-galactosidase